MTPIANKDNLALVDIARLENQEQINAEILMQLKQIKSGMLSLRKPWNVKQVANFFSIGEATVRKWAKEGKVKAFKLGGKDWLFKPESVEEFYNGLFAE
ncbi:MAG: helix-turn-helix domain-containing protein [Bacteroidota bacterium]